MKNIMVKGSKFTCGFVAVACLYFLFLPILHKSRAHQMKSIQFAKKALHNIFVSTKKNFQELKYQKITKGYGVKGYKRIYFFHIRKTGGTSLNIMFLSLSNKTSKLLYSELSKDPSQRIIRNNLIYVGWNISHINKGNYFYAFSHTPAHKLNLPKSTFTISCFRDPVKRVLSLYNMLMGYQENNIDHPCMATEGKWLGKTFDDFLKKIPREHLLNQLYMFSESFNISEAVDNVKQLSHYFFSDEFADGVRELNLKTDLSLEPIHVRKTKYQSHISTNQLTDLRKVLDDEYIFLDTIRSMRNSGL